MNMKMWTILLICIILLSLFISCNRGSVEKSKEKLDPETAKKKLGELKIEVTEKNFLNQCSRVNVETVRLFIAAGMNPNVTESPSGKTCLTLASERVLLATEREGSKFDDVEVVKVLLAAGADVNVSANESPYKGAIVIYPKGIKTPENRKISHTPLFFAVVHNKDAVVKLLLEAGADYNVRDELGYTPLIEASVPVRERVVKALLDKGADPNIGSYEGTTPLMRASLRGGGEVIEMLLNAGADCSQKDVDGKDVFQLLQESGTKTPGYTSPEVREKMTQILKSRCK